MCLDCVSIPVVWSHQIVWPKWMLTFNLTRVCRNCLRQLHWNRELMPNTNTYMSVLNIRSKNQFVKCPWKAQKHFINNYKSSINSTDLQSAYTTVVSERKKIIFKLFWDSSDNQRLKGWIKFLKSFFFFLQFWLFVVVIVDNAVHKESKQKKRNHLDFIHSI
jgi:hypothetical protein